MSNGFEMLSSDVEQQYSTDGTKNGSAGKRKKLYVGLGIGVLILIGIGVYMYTSSSTSSSSGTTPTQVHLKLSVQWPPSFCASFANQKRSKIADVCRALSSDEKWIIHGLWPSWETKLQSSSQFSERDLQGVPE